MLTGIALFGATGSRAQTDSGPKSRLEMGQKPASVGRVIHSRNFPFLKHPSVASLDRNVSVSKNAAINAYYRSALLNNSSAKTTTRPAAELGNAVAAENRQQSAEELRKLDERMYATEKLIVSNIYPNPANDFAEIDYQISGSVNEAKLMISSVLGAPVAEYTLDRNDRKVRIATRDLTTGMYFYTLSVDGKKVATKKLLIRHQ